MNAPLLFQRETIREADLRDGRTAARIEAFVAEQEGTPFHRPAWLQAVESGTGQRARGLLAERFGSITGWLPLVEARSPLFPAALVSSGFGVGGGILATSETSTALLASGAEELAARRSCASIELRGGPVPRAWRAQHGKHADFSAPLADGDEALLAAIPRKQRAEVRRGLGRSFVITTGTAPTDRAAHYAVYAESVRNLGTPVFPKTLFTAVVDRFAGAADILTVWLDGAPVASVLSLYHRGVAMPYWGGGTYAARASRANERMYYELMRHAAARGCHAFDFGRSKVGSGAFAYKKNWGFTPRELVYGIWEAPGQVARDVDPTSAAHSARIDAWKRLPLPVANALGPYIARGLA